MTSDSNPYAPPNDSCSDGPVRLFDRRLTFLLLPPLIPTIVHVVVRPFVPADESLYHGMFTLVATIPAWVWAQSMIDRLRLSFWKSYCVTCIAWGAVLASALFSSLLIDFITAGHSAEAR